MDCLDFQFESSKVKGQGHDTGDQM